MSLSRFKAGTALCAIALSVLVSGCAVHNKGSSEWLKVPILPASKDLKTQEGQDRLNQANQSAQKCYFTARLVNPTEQSLSGFITSRDGSTRENDNYLAAYKVRPYGKAAVPINPLVRRSVTITPDRRVLRGRFGGKINLPDCPTGNSADKVTSVTYEWHRLRGWVFHPGGYQPRR